MTTLYTPEQSAQILNTMQAAEDSNNGWAYCGPEVWLRLALHEAGYFVVQRRHGADCVYRVYTARAMDALRAEWQEGSGMVSKVRELPRERAAVPDHENAILSRQEPFMPY